MARPPDGKVKKDVSRTALYAYIAARLHGIRTSDQDRFFRDELRVLVSQKSAARAATRTRGSRSTGRRGQSARQRIGRKHPLRNWLLVDVRKLGLELAVVRFPGEGRRQKDLVDSLKKLVGVRQVIETEERGDVLAIVMFAGVDHRRDLRAQLEELSDRLYWQNVLSESHEPALASWRALARRAADAEGLGA